MIARESPFIHPTLTVRWLLGLALLASSVSVSAETRGYAISLIHTATYPHEGNCPGGGNGGVDDIEKRILMRMGYSEDEALRIMANGGVDESGQKVDTRKRGYLDGQVVDISNFPTAVPDPEIEVVQGRFAHGFNLNGRMEPDSFVNPLTGERGIDNQMWRVLGCFDAYNVSHPVIPYSEGIAWDTAMDSMPAWLLSISGDDPGKDGDVMVTFDRALNVVMRNALGEVLPASSYTVDPDPRSHSVFQGQIEDGIVTIEPGDFSMQGESQFYALLRFTNTQLRLEMHPDGTLSGFIGGYQPWLDYFHYLAIRGEGASAQVNIPGVYYAMRRLADADPDPVTGQNRAISTAYYIEAVPVFHTTIDGETVAWAYEGEAASDTRGIVAQQAATEQEQ